MDGNDPYSPSPFRPMWLMRPRSHILHFTSCEGRRKTMTRVLFQSPKLIFQWCPFIAVWKPTPSALNMSSTHIVFPFLFPFLLISEDGHCVSMCNNLHNAAGFHVNNNWIKVLYLIWTPFFWMEARLMELLAQHCPLLVERHYCDTGQLSMVLKKEWRDGGADLSPGQKWAVGWKKKHINLKQSLHQRSISTVIEAKASVQTSFQQISFIRA